jgi:ABC-2 type transport system permease protein
MRVLAANIEDVMREAAARWTLLAYFFLSTVFIIIFAAALNLDVVDGALAGAKLFGKDLEVDGGDKLNIEKLVLGFEIGFSAFLYIICTFMAVFATAHLVPRMQDKGTIDLYLSRPISRFKLLMTRYLAGLILAASNVLYLMGAVWLIVVYKTRVAHPRIFVAALIIMLVIAVLMAFAFLVGTVTSSTAVSIMMTFGIAIFSAMLFGHDKFSAMVEKEWQAWLIDGMYWVLPKTSDLMLAVMGYVGTDVVPDEMMKSLTPAPFLTTAAFGIVCLALATWRFTKKEF